MTVHGLFRLGFFVGVMAIHPMKVGKTFMSTFLFNCILVMIISPAVVQFCAWAFAMYAEGTTVQDIFLGEVRKRPSVAHDDPRGGVGGCAPGQGVKGA